MSHRCNIDDAELKAAYEAGTHSTVLAKEYGCCVRTILNRLIELGVTRRKGTPRPRTPRIVVDLDAVRELYDEGHSVSEIGSRLCCDVRTVVRRLKMLGIRPRTLAESLGTIATRRKMSAAHQGISVDQWNGFADDESHKTPEYQAWRKMVIRRDSKTCLICSCRPRRLHVHHILLKSRFPGLRLDVNNGATLCSWCHTSIRNKEPKYAAYFYYRLRNRLQLNAAA